MSGHNKWTQIKRKKETEDAKKSQRFAMLAKTITLEAKRSGGDKNSPGLRTAIERARTANLPNNNIERAIQNAVGGDTTSLDEVRYEAYGPGGVALMIEGITDNKNRTSQEIKHLLSKHGANLATPGSVLWSFEKTTDGWRPSTTITVSDEQTKQTLKQLLDDLEHHEDVKQTVTNLCVS